MMKKAINMTEGPLAKQILFVSLPLVMSNLLQVLFNISDVAIVGRFAGSTALGSVGSTSIFVTLFTLVKNHQLKLLKKMNLFLNGKKQMVNIL